MPILIFLVVMFAFVGLAFILENAEATARATPTAATNRCIAPPASSHSTSRLSVDRPSAVSRAVSVPATAVRSPPMAFVVACAGPRSTLSVAGGQYRRDACGGPVVVLASLGAMLTHIGYIPWPRLIAALVLIILFIPIRRYTLPGHLPFQLEPYRVFVALLVLGWVGLAARRLADHVSPDGIRRPAHPDPGIRLSRPMLANPGRVATISTRSTRA